MSHLRIEFLFGVGFDKLGNPIPKVQVERTLESLLAAMAEEFGGCTLTTSVGSWKGPLGHILTEVGYVAVTTIPCDPNFQDQYDVQINRMRQAITTSFNQESVLAIRSLCEIVPFPETNNQQENTHASKTD